MSQIHEGYILVDHRNSPGFTEAQALALGYNPEHMKGGTVFEAKTNHCNHCGTVVILNPLRIRERAYCQPCNKYICDNCGIAQRMPDYVHKTYAQQLTEAHNFFSKGSLING